MTPAAFNRRVQLGSNEQTLLVNQRLLWVEPNDALATRRTAGIGAFPP
jgi:hypothetical protein